MTVTPVPACSRCDATPASEGLRCFHCERQVLAERAVWVNVDGERRPVCCDGCAEVVRTIAAGDLTRFYGLRSRPSAPGREVTEASLRDLRSYNHPAVEPVFSRELERNRREAHLMLEGIECSACVWLNEQRLASLPGIELADVNYATRRARVVWDPERIQLGEILEAVERIGYRAHPYDPVSQEQRLDQERRQHLQRLGVSGLLGMQVMMVALGLYLGEWMGMEPAIRELLRWVSLILTVPVLGYCALPFFSGAVRDLRRLRPGMDVPVALGIGIAFVASVVATVSGVHEIYFDSVVMFVFFLLLARFLEFSVRRDAAGQTEALTRKVPALARRLNSRETGAPDQSVAVAALVGGDRILVRAGEATKEGS